MSTTFQQAFSGLLQARVFEGSCVEVMKDPEFRSHTFNSTQLFNKLIDVLSEEHQGLLRELEAEWGLAESYSIEYAYKQGLKDGILFAKEIGLAVSEGGANGERTLAC